MWFSKGENGIVGRLARKGENWSYSGLGIELKWSAQWVSKEKCWHRKVKDFFLKEVRLGYSDHWSAGMPVAIML